MNRPGFAGAVHIFSLKGKLLDVWAELGKVYSVPVTPNFLWASTQPVDQPYGDFSGWLLKLDNRGGKAEGHLAIPETHSFSAAGRSRIVTNIEGRVIQWDLN